MSQYPQDQPMPPEGQYPYYPQQPMQEQSPFQQYSQQPPPGFQFPPPGSYGPPQQPPPKRKSRKGLWIALAVVLVLAVVICGVIGMANSSSTASTQAQSSPQDEAVYKANATNTDVASLDKNGSAGQGTDVHFTCTIVTFVKDSTGVTAGANVTDPTSSSSSIIQVIFTSSTDITKLNTGDVLEVWGNDQGASSGTNAFGATIQEVVIQAQYMIDQTTVYRVDS